jgi:hypothetical protein
MVQPNSQIVFLWIIDILWRHIFAAWISVPPIKVYINSASMIFLKLFNWYGTAKWSDCSFVNHWHSLAINLCGKVISATTWNECQWSINNLCKAAQLVWYIQMVRLNFYNVLASTNDKSLQHEYQCHHENWMSMECQWSW